MLAPVSAREAFHVLLLEYLTARLRPAPPSAFALKGGVNLRLYFGSPRYSQDIDFDAEPRLGRWDELCLMAGALIERLLALPAAARDASDV